MLVLLPSNEAKGLDREDALSYRCWKGTEISGFLRSVTATFT